MRNHRGDRQLYDLFGEIRRHPAAGPYDRRRQETSFERLCGQHGLSDFPAARHPPKFERKPIYWIMSEVAKTSRAGYPSEILTRPDTVAVAARICTPKCWQKDHSFRPMTN